MSEIRFFLREEPYGFLSNFDRTPFIAPSQFGDAKYPTNEHYYQSQKTDDEQVFDWIRNAPNARLAMIMGRQLEHNKYLKYYMREDWEGIKNRVMLEGLRAKFMNIELKKKLLATGDAVLIENNPEDFYWGIGDGSGKNMLGKLLMQVRDELIEEVSTE